jgi:hypothetical protein
MQRHGGDAGHVRAYRPRKLVVSPDNEEQISWPAIALWWRSRRCAADLASAPIKHPNLPIR